jgi:DNA-binding NarL/FixJ family response regulator
LSEIARAIRAVHAGETYLEPRIASKIVAELRPGRKTGALSRREREVLGLVAGGQSNKQIARSLGITERTVKFHVASVLNKLGAENRAQAVALAGHRGLI